MIGMKATTQFTPERLLKAVERASLGSVRAAAYLIMVGAKQSILRAPPPAKSSSTAKIKGSGKRKNKRGRRIPSPAGSPPFTRGGQLPRAIGYAVEGESAVIGPAYSMVGTSAEPHEKSGEYKGATYPKRSFMGPSLDRTSPIFGGSFKGSVGG